MDYQFYCVEKKPPIAWVYLNRPRKLNAMDPPAWEELIPICRDIDADKDIRVVIIASKAPIFCAGIDLIGMMPELPELMVKEQMGGLKLQLLQKIYTLQNGLTCLEKCRKPIIAAVHGKCIGAGLDMITACDIRLCTEDASFSLAGSKGRFRGGCRRFAASSEYRRAGHRPRAGFYGQGYRCTICQRGKSCESYISGQGHALSGGGKNGC